MVASNTYHLEVLKSLKKVEFAHLGKPTRRAIRTHHLPYVRLIGRGRGHAAIELITARYEKRPNTNRFAL